jgi:hypothetical protein
MAIKVFTSAQLGAPVLTGQAGSLITLLDAVLVNGFGSANLSGISRSGTTATATSVTPHGFATGDSAVIANATQPEYNGEFVVNVLTTTTFTYQVTGTPASPATTATTMTSSRAPANYDKAFAGTNKAAYRSRDTSGSRPYLQIIDDGTTTGAAREAKTRGYLTMSDVDTGSEPFPTVAQYANGLKTYKSTSVDATPRQWTLFTDGKTFYFMASMDGTSTTKLITGGYIWWLGFGDIFSNRPGDLWTAFLGACHAENQQVSGTSGANHNGMTVSVNRTTVPTSASCYIVRGFWGTAGAAIMGHLGHGWDANAIGSIGTTPYPHIPDNGFLMVPLQSVQGGVYRGRTPGLFEPIQGRCLNPYDVIENVAGYPGRKFMAMWGQSMQSTNTTGMIMVDITGNPSTGKWD